MASGRKAIPKLAFNGKNVNTALADYLESVTYTDVASGSSDTIQIELQNITLKWLKNWYPSKGDRIAGSIRFMDWDAQGKNKILACGVFILDEIKFGGGPLKGSFGATALPANSSIKTLERTQTWKKVTLKGIAEVIAKRYGLKLSYTAETIKITSMEQSQQSDSAFLYKLCEDYDLAMKIYNKKIVIYDQTTMEKKKARTTLTRESFIDDRWEYSDELEGSYTGARISYKAGKSNKEISIYLGVIAEKAKGSRVLRINESADSVADAYYKAAAAVNKANQQMTTLSGSIWPNPSICAGATVQVTGFGKMSGKYYIDKSTMSVSENGTSQQVEMHKCQKRLKHNTKPEAAAATSSHKVGDIVQFAGGKHYVSSYASAKGYTAKAGPAKITLGPDSAGNGKAHPWHLIHTDKTSNVYGWVDEGSFS